MATFTIGETTQYYLKGNLTDIMRLVCHQSPSSGTLLTGHVYLDDMNGHQCRLAIYESGSTGGLIAQSNIITGTSDSRTWYQADIGPSSLSEGTWYNLAIWGDSDLYSDMMMGEVEGFRRWSKAGVDFSATDPDGDFTTQDPLSGLDLGTGYTMCIYFTCTVEEPSEDITVETSGCTASGSRTATIAGYLSEGSGNCWLLWDTEDQGVSSFPGDWSYSSNKGYQNDDTVFTEDLTGLSPNTTYHWRAYAESGSNEDWSTDDQFTTKSLLMTAEYSGCTASGMTTATITGYLSAGSGNCWLCWEAGPGGTNDLSSWDTSSNEGYQNDKSVFTENLTSLTDNTSYAYRAYVESGGIDDWSTTDTFTTKPLAMQITTDECLISGDTTGTIRGHLTAGSGTTWLLWDTEDRGVSSFPGTWSNSSNKGYQNDDTIVTEELTGLSNATTYHWRAYVESSNTSDWSDTEATFTTTGEMVPIVALTSGVTNRAKTTATINGYLSQGSGTCWLFWGSTDGLKVMADWDSSSNEGTITDDSVFSENIDSLTAGTQYFFRAYCSSNWDEANDDWSPTYNFYTISECELAYDSVISGANQSEANIRATSTVNDGSGNVWLFYGETNGEEDKSSWDYSSQATGIKYTSDSVSITAPSLDPETKYWFRGYISSNGWGGGEDWWDESKSTTTTSLREGVPILMDTMIWYGSLAGTDYISSQCSRWEMNDYTLTFETWLTKDKLQTLRANITPGATGELFSILGKPTYIDKTWQGNNTIKLEPINSKLTNMRRTYTGYVKSISSSPIEGDSGWIDVKLEMYISGNKL